MPEQTNAPMMPVDVANLERDTAPYCQGCWRDTATCGPVARYVFPLREMDYDKLYFCRECSLAVAGTIEEIWHAYDRACGARPNTHSLLPRAVHHLTQAALLLSRMDV